MSAAPPAAGVRLALGSYSAATRLLPRRFRERWAADMCADFRGRLAELAAVAGAGSVFRFWLRNLLDVLRLAWRERTDSSFLPPAPRRQHPHERETMLQHLLYDLRHAARSLTRRPAYALIVLLTLAVGIGANTAIFTVVRGALLRPLPYEQPEQLMSIWGEFRPVSGFEFPVFPLSPPEFVDYRADNESMTEVAAFSSASATITGPEGEAERVRGLLVTPGMFEVLRVQPALGRAFTHEEGTPEAERTVILSDGYWRQRFAGDVDIVGREIVLDGEARTVVGVLPPGFGFPDSRFQMWSPLQIDYGDPGNRRSHWLQAIGRLAPGRTLEQASAEIEGMMAGWQEQYPDIHTGHHLWLRPRVDDLIGPQARRALLVLLAASAFVLLIVCANVASATLARGEERSRELAIRGALGAGRGRLVRLMLLESTLLSLLGGALGVLVAAVGVPALLSMGAGAVPRAESVRLDGVVILFGLAVALLTGLLFGLAPALRASGETAEGAMREGARGASGGRRAALFRRGLVVVEVALCFVLVVGAGLMVLTLQGLLAEQIGFEVERRVAVEIDLPSARYAEAGAVEAFMNEAEARLGALPGVRRVDTGAYLPFLSGTPSWDFTIEGQTPPGEGEQAWNADVQIFSPGMLETMGMSLLRGRSFDERDTVDSQLVVMINETMATRFFPGEDPLGQRLHVNGDEGYGWATIVGVVGDTRRDLGADPRPAYYFVASQGPRTTDSVYRRRFAVLEAEGDPAALMASIRAEIRALDDALPLATMTTLREAVRDSVAGERFRALLFALFAGVALVLGGSGVYGVLSYAVARRTREIGIRRALGAQSGRIATGVVAQAMSLAGIGLLLGAGLAALGAGWIGSLLHGIDAMQPALWLGVAAVIASIAVIACWVPTRRALTVSAVEALRPD